MMVKLRSRRVGEQIKKEVSEIIRLELKDPGLINLTSVTGVEISRDLRYAKIFVSIYDSQDAQENVMKILKRASGFVRAEIGKRIRLRHVPEIEFRLDRSMEYGDRIEGVLRNLGSESGADKFK
jgi:ribosome-binding factor A